MGWKKIVTLAASMAGAAVLSSFVTPGAPQPSASQQTLPACRWRVDVNPCTSCSPEVYSDSECKRDNNGYARTCVDDVNICGNGALCDADLGTGECQ